VVLAVLVLSCCWFQIPAFFRIFLPGPEPVHAVYRWLLPFRSVNTYGLFPSLPASRLEIIIEGSNDGLNWSAYEFKYKPGDVKTQPRFAAPYPPRLDWQMWRAAATTLRAQPWLVNLCIRLLQGAPDVLALLKDDPFPQAPPRYLRAVLYEYRFTDRSTRRQTGAWWQREPSAIYLPPLSLSSSAIAAPDAARAIRANEPLWPRR
jgi:hypothetical protein